MDKYIWAEAQNSDVEIKSIMATSFNNAEEKVIEKYAIEFEEDDSFADIFDWEELSYHLYSEYGICLSKLEIIDEL